MAEYINTHGHNNPEHVFGVECAQNSTQTHGTTSVGQLVQHASKFGALIQHS